MFAVIFEVKPRPKNWQEYLDHAAMLRPELLQIEGFLANERYASRRRPGWLVSVSFWRDEKALIRWRAHALHSEVQGKGRNAVLADYHLRVGEVVSDTHAEPGGALPQQRFDVTEVGVAKAMTVTERPIEVACDEADTTQGEPDPATGDGVAEPVERELFDSITRPGNGLYLQTWLDQASAQMAASSAPGRHRVIRIIRDYGMFARHEAPQYYPPVRSAAGDDFAADRQR